MKNLALYEKFKKLNNKDCIEDLGEALIEAAKKNKLDEVQYLLTSTDLKFHADIHIYDDSSLRHACRHGNLEIVDYLLSSPELKEHANIHASNDYCIKTSCRHGYLDILKYLISPPKLIEKIDIHTQNDYPFRSAFTGEQLEIIQYLIFDLQIKKTTPIEDHLKGYIDAENITHISETKFAKQVQNMFSIQELNNNLKSELNYNNTKNKFPKI